jgi:HEPN domain-containing protein
VIRMNKEDILQYWIKSSDNDFRAMIHLFDKGDYSWSLFIGHLVLEKLLKAWYVQKVDITPPFIHDLVRLAEKAGILLTEEQKDILDTISTFNLQTRYDDYKMSFQRKCSRAFTEKWIDEIKEFREWIKNKLPKQR